MGPLLTSEERLCSLSRRRQAAPPNLHRSFALSCTRHPFASDRIEEFGRRKKKRNNRNRSIVVDLEPSYAQEGKHKVPHWSDNCSSSMVGSSHFRKQRYDAGPGYFQVCSSAKHDPIWSLNPLLPDMVFLPSFTNLLAGLWDKLGFGSLLPYCKVALNRVS